MKSYFLSVFILINFLVIFSATSQSSIIKEKTIANDKELVGAVVAKIEDVAWIKGHWKGEAFGGNAEEIWSEHAVGAMMGMFRLTSDGKTSFYELMVIREVNNSLILQLKHFHHDMKGWEEKDQTLREHQAEAPCKDHGARLHRKDDWGSHFRKLAFDWFLVIK